MNNMPKTWSKLAMGIASCCLIVEPAWACTPSFGPVGMAVILGIIGLCVLGPASLALAGLFSAVAARREGLSVGRGLTVGLALVCETAIAALTGAGSLVGVLAVGLGALQLAFLALAAVYGPAETPLTGRLTVLSSQALANLRV